MSAGGGPINQQIQAALMGQYPMATQLSPTGGQMAPGMQQSLQGNQAMVQQLGQGQSYPQYGMPQAQPQAQPQQGGYMDLMRSLMTNPAAFTGGQQGGFAQTLAANPQGSLANWQPAAPPQQAAPNPIPGLLAQQQAAQAQQAQQAAVPALAVDPNNPGGFSGSGGE